METFKTNHCEIKETAAPMGAGSGVPGGGGGGVWKRPPIPTAPVWFQHAGQPTFNDAIPDIPGQITSVHTMSIVFSGGRTRFMVFAPQQERNTSDTTTNATHAPCNGGGGGLRPTVLCTRNSQICFLEKKRNVPLGICRQGTGHGK